MNNSNNEHENLLDIVIDLREKNNTLLSNLQEFNRLKSENAILQKNLKEIENSFKILKEDNARLVKKIEEYQESNRSWESKVKDINTFLSKLEDKNKFLKKSNDELVNLVDHLEFQHKILKEKEFDHNNNFTQINNFQKEYENLISELKIKKSEMRNKEHFYKQEIDRYQFAVAEYEKNLDLNVKENVMLKEKMTKTEKFMFDKEKEFCEIKILKEKEIVNIKNSLKQISKDYEEEILSLHKTMDFYKEKLRAGETNQIHEKKLNLMLREKDETIKKLNIEIVELKNIKKNCVNLLQQINF